MVGLPELIYVGNHGLERIARGTPWTHPVAAAAQPSIAAAPRRSRARRGRWPTPWLLIENRGSPARSTIVLPPIRSRRPRCWSRWRRSAADRHGLRLTLGRMIFEVRPALAVNKGTAIRELAQDLGLRGIVFGDDVTDVDAFARCASCGRQEAATLRVGVLGPDTSPAVLAEIDLSVLASPPARRP